MGVSDIWGITLNGPGRVCPGQTGVAFYVNSLPPLYSKVHVQLIEPDGVTFPDPITQGVFLEKNDSKTVSFNFNTNQYSATILVRAYTVLGVLIETASFPVSKSGNVPALPNGGTVIGCAPNQEVAISSLPFLQNNENDCYFHCFYDWLAPSGWDLKRYVTNPATGNPLIAADAIVFPPGLSNGHVGYLKVTARYDTCGSINNTSSTSSIWYGPPGVPTKDLSIRDSSNNEVQIQLYLNPFAGTTCSWSIISGSGTFQEPYTTGPANTVTSPGGCVVRVAMTNACGTTNYDITIPASFGMRSAYPNPAQDFITLEFGDNSAHILPDKIEIFSENSSNPVKIMIPEYSDYFKRNKKIALDVRELPRGIYYLHIQSKKTKNKYRVLLQ